MPGDGIAAFFDKPPRACRRQEDPFAEDATTTIYEQYGYAGLRWHTYDLGCGPDMSRNPDAVIGTAVSNWIMQHADRVVRADLLDHRGRVRIRPSWTSSTPRSNGSPPPCTTACSPPGSRR